jgi:hypothetical protein
VDANLAAFSQRLQALDYRILTIVAAEMKVEEDPEVMYPKHFDVRNFSDKVAQVRRPEEDRGTRARRVWPWR